MKFLTIVSLNGQDVSKGFGSSKKESKQAAVKILLKLLCPKIYQEWAKKNDVTLQHPPLTSQVSKPEDVEMS